MSQHAEHEGALVVVEVGDADDHGGGAAVLGGEPGADVEGDALAPAGEGGGAVLDGALHKDERPTLEV